MLQVWEVARSKNGEINEMSEEQLKEFDIDDDLRYWITPPELFDKLDDEFHFDYDPCVYPKVEDTLVKTWGKINYVNPPFRKKDGSPTAFVRKAIKEQVKGNSSVVVLPTPSYVNLLIEANAEIRPLGRVAWISAITNKPMKSPSSITLFYLKGKK